MKFKGEFEKEGSPYRIIMCRVLKRDVGRFEETLEKLKDKMLIMGYKDYDKMPYSQMYQGSDHQELQ